MRLALLQAAGAAGKAHPLHDVILKSAKQNKPRKFGGWFVIRKKGEKRVRRNR